MPQPPASSKSSPSIWTSEDTPSVTIWAGLAAAGDRPMAQPALFYTIASRSSSSSCSWFLSSWYIVIIITFKQHSHCHHYHFQQQRHRWFSPLLHHCVILNLPHHHLLNLLQHLEVSSWRWWILCQHWRPSVRKMLSERGKKSGQEEMKQSERV